MSIPVSKDTIEPKPVFTLATDLDGTFLGGTLCQRQALYTWIESNRSHLNLIFVTGRDLPFISQSCAEGMMPWPDYVIGDVGTTIAVRDQRTNLLKTDPVLESPIVSRWGDGIEPIRNKLEDAPGITPQDGDFRYRMSYHYEPLNFDVSIKSIVEDAGFDCLISDNRFFDVLPKGINKGSSLMRLVNHLGISPEQILVAGDTLNDRSLFETGLNGVAVGNSEAALVEQIKKLENVYFANGHGAEGVWEAIKSLGYQKCVIKSIEKQKEVL